MSDDEGHRSIAPSPKLPDHTPLDKVDLGRRVNRALAFYGFKTVGEVRESTEEALLSLPDMGRGSLKMIRETLALPSSEGVRPSLK